MKKVIGGPLSWCEIPQYLLHKKQSLVMEAVNLLGKELKCKNTRTVSKSFQIFFMSHTLCCIFAPKKLDEKDKRETNLQPKCIIIFTYT